MKDLNENKEVFVVSFRESRKHIEKENLIFDHQNIDFS